MDINVDRLRKLADVIEEHPDRFDMRSWLCVPGSGWPENITRIAATTDLLADDVACGTTACIAGWACSLWAAEVNPDRPVDDNAARILGLVNGDADALFYLQTFVEQRHLDASRVAGVLRALADGRDLCDITRELRAEFGL